MKHLSLLFLVFLISSGISSSCVKNTNYKSVGTITGQDMAACACCGGYLIHIDNTVYRFDPNELPFNNLNLSSENMPLEVLLTWDVQNNTCAWLTITAIKKN